MKADTAAVGHLRLWAGGSSITVEGAQYVYYILVNDIAGFQKVWRIVIAGYNGTFSFQFFTLELVKYPKVLNLQVPVACDSKAG